MSKREADIQQVWADCVGADEREADIRQAWADCVGADDPDQLDQWVVDEIMLLQDELARVNRLYGPDVDEEGVDDDGHLADIRATTDESHIADIRSNMRVIESLLVGVETNISTLGPCSYASQPVSSAMASIRKYADRIRRATS